MLATVLWYRQSIAAMLVDVRLDAVPGRWSPIRSGRRTAGVGATRPWDGNVHHHTHQRRYWSTSMSQQPPLISVRYCTDSDRAFERDGFEGDFGGGVRLRETSSPPRCSPERTRRLRASRERGLPPGWPGCPRLPCFP